MFAARLDSLICDLRQQLCPPSLPDKDGWSDGIVFNLRLWLSSGGKDERAYARVLFTRRTSVFVDISYQHDFVPLSKQQWRFWANTCNHDECWRSDGLRCLTDLYFEMADRVDPEKAPSHLADHSSLGLLGGPAWQLVRCKVVRDETDPNGHRKRLDGLELKPRE